jgi:hypothetical protein
MALWLGTGWTSGVRLPAGARKGYFSLRRRVQAGSGAHPTSYPMATEGSFIGMKRPGREFDHSSPSSAEVNVFMVWCLIKYRIRIREVALS